MKILLILYCILNISISLSQDFEIKYDTVYTEGDRYLFCGNSINNDRVGIWHCEDTFTKSYWEYLYFDLNRVIIIGYDSTGIIQGLNSYLLDASDSGEIMINDGIQINYSYGFISSIYCVRNEVYCDTSLVYYPWGEGVHIMIVYDSKNYMKSLYKKFYKNGNLETVGNFYETSNVGVWKSYYENGLLREVVTYKKYKVNKLNFRKSNIDIDYLEDYTAQYFSVKNGKSYYWDERGVFKYSLVYKNGTIKDTVYNISKVKDVLLHSEKY
jgi:hypothetical protein